MPLTSNELTAQDVATLHFLNKNMMRLMGKLQLIQGHGPDDPDLVNSIQRLNTSLLSMNALPVMKYLIYTVTGKEQRTRGALDISQLDNKTVYKTLTPDQQKDLRHLQSFMKDAHRALRDIAKNDLNTDLKTTITQTAEQVTTAGKVLNRVAEPVSIKAPNPMVTLANTAIAQRKAAGKLPPSQRISTDIFENYEPNHPEQSGLSSQENAKVKSPNTPKKK